MSLVLVRVDCRLIHGQVVETWVPHTGADCLVVANDDLCSNPFLRSVMELAVPRSIHVIFCRLDEVADALGREIESSVDRINAYMDEHRDELFGALLDYLDEAGTIYFIKLAHPGGNQKRKPCLYHFLEHRYIG